MILEGIMLTIVSGAVGILVIGIWLALEPLLKDKPYSYYVKSKHKTRGGKK